MQFIRPEQGTTIIPRLSISLHAHCSTEDMLIISLSTQFKTLHLLSIHTSEHKMTVLCKQQIFSRSRMRKVLLVINQWDKKLQWSLPTSMFSLGFVSLKTSGWFLSYAALKFLLQPHKHNSTWVSFRSILWPQDYMGSFLPQLYPKNYGLWTYAHVHFSMHTFQLSVCTLPVMHVHASSRACACF